MGDLLIEIPAKNTFDKLLSMIKTYVRAQEIILYNGSEDQDGFLAEFRGKKLPRAEASMMALTYFSLYGINSKTRKDCENSLSLDATNVTQIVHFLTTKGYLVKVDNGDGNRRISSEIELLKKAAEASDSTRIIFTFNVQS